jgi:hypothetical protein
MNSAPWSLLWCTGYMKIVFRAEGVSEVWFLVQRLVTVTGGPHFCPQGNSPVKMARRFDETKSKHAIRTREVIYIQSRVVSVQDCLVILNYYVTLTLNHDSLHHRVQTASGVKQPGPEADDSLHLMPRSNNEWSYTPTLPIRLHGVVLS